MKNKLNPFNDRRRGSNLLRRIGFLLLGRIKIFQNSFSILLLAAFFGFILANIFGTFLMMFRNVLFWDGFIIFGLVFLVEIANYLTYHSLERRFLGFFPSPVIIEATILCNPLPLLPPFEKGVSGVRVRIVNNFKVGLLLGFFVEAFKVGS